MILLMTADGKVYMSYLEDIFEKICSLNRQLQEANATLCDAKAKIFGFATFLSLCRSSLFVKKLCPIFLVKRM